MNDDENKKLNNFSIKTILILLIIETLMITGAHGYKKRTFKQKPIGTFFIANTEIINIEHSRSSGFNNTKDIKIHYIDVGQGDSIFIELPNSETALIDAGTSKSGNQIISYIKNLGCSSINYIIATHPHADHIGSMKKVIENFKVEQLFLPPVQASTITYKKLINTAIEKNIKITSTTVMGVKIFEYDNLKFEVLSPVQNVSYSDLNNWSIVAKLSYGDSDFLFTGDAETEAETILLKQKTNLQSEVLKAGHHGSRTSSSKTFVQAVNPMIAVISCGKNNKYKHPNIETLDLFKNLKITEYRTDLQGSILIEANKKETFKVTSEKTTKLEPPTKVFKKIIEK